MFRDETGSAHSKAILDDSWITVDTTSLHQRKLYYCTNYIITIALNSHKVKVNSTSCAIQWLNSLHSVCLTWFVIGHFCFPLRKKYLDLSFEYKLTYVKRVFDERWGVIFFPRKFHHCFWRSKHDVIYNRQRIPRLTPDVIPFLAHWIFPSKVNRNKTFRLQNQVLQVKRKYS